MRHDQACALLRQQAEEFAALAATTPLQLPVPTCPGWRVAHLVTHVGQVHRWVAEMVRLRVADRLAPDGLLLDVPAAAARPAWCAEGSAGLLLALEAATGTEPVWTWGSGDDVAWWSRRMLHETAVHHVDLRAARGEPPRLPDLVALDGIDELVGEVEVRARSSPGPLTGGGGTVSLRCDGRSWTVRWRPDVEVSGAPPDLLLLLYGRTTVAASGCAVAGEVELLERLVRAWAR